MTSYLAKQQAYKEDPKAFTEGQYFGASVMPGTGEAIAAYELPGILSLGGGMIQSGDPLKALGGAGLITLGTAATLPIVGPGAKFLKKGLEGFIPYLGPKPAAEGVDTSVLMSQFGNDPTKFEPKGKVSDTQKARELGQEELFPSAVKKEDQKEELSFATKGDETYSLGPGSLFNPETKQGRKLLIVSCSDKKCPDDKNMKAIDRYLGPVFQSLRKQGVPENVDVAIMSAKHGLITANTPLKNYNEKMSVAKAQAFKNDPDQLNRIKNTMTGYDDVIVQGGPLYKDVIRAAAGDLKINEIPGGRGIGDQRKSVINAIKTPFSKIDTPVYHYTKKAKEGFTEFRLPDDDPDPLSVLGVHVGSTPKAAKDRYVATVYGPAVKTYYRQGMDLDTAIKKTEKEYGADQIIYNQPGKDISPGSVPLKADLSKPFLNPETKKPFTESELFRLLEKPDDVMDTVIYERTVDNAKELRKLLSKKGFTHIPYVNDFEDAGNLSYIMLVDRPKGTTKVLQSPFAKKDPSAADDPDIMKQEGGVVEMKDKAINMNRGPRGIGPFAQYLETGGEVQPERNIFEEQAPKIVPAKTEAEALSELADQEMGLELINRVGSDPLAYKMMQAGLRDNRTLSDFLTIYPTVTDDMTEKQRKDSLTEQIRGLGLAQGMYFPLDNMVVVAPMNVADDYFQSPTDMIIMHEILHKGAETLKKDPNVNIKSLREKLDTDDYANIGDETKPGRAEHRYIQAIVNKAYVDNMLTQSSIYANRAINEARKILNDPKSDDFKKELAEDAIKFESKYVERNQKRALLKEIRRSTDFYMEQSGKDKFKQSMNKMFPNKGLFDEDAEDVENNFTLKELKQIFNLLNTTMLDQPGTKEFALEMSKSAPAGASIKGYSDLFPTQFADPTKPYFNEERKRTYDLEGIEDPSYIQVMSARSKYLEKMRKDREKQNKAKGGVVEMKDKAVNMYRGTQGIEPFIKYMV